jgi:hypothetical protein
VVVTELLGGQAAAQKLLPRPLSAVLDRAIAGTCSGARSLRAADLARSLSTEASNEAELAAELRLSWPCFTAPSRLPPPPRLPDFSRVGTLRAVPRTAASEPQSVAPETIPARPSAVR